MSVRIRRRVISLGCLLGLLLPLAGCSALWFLGDAAASFAGGWLASSRLGQQETATCYQNGEPVECSTLPSSMLP